MLQIKSLDVFQRTQNLCSNLIYQALKIGYSILRVVIVYLYYQENHERKVPGERRRVRKLDLDETSIAHYSRSMKKKQARFGRDLAAFCHAKRKNGIGRKIYIKCPTLRI